MAYFYSAVAPRARGALWPICGPALTSAERARNEAAESYNATVEGAVEIANQISYMSGGGKVASGGLHMNCSRSKRFRQQRSQPSAPGWLFCSTYQETHQKH
jgi:hypothetical protein